MFPISSILFFENLLPHCHTSFKCPLFKGILVLWQQMKMWQQKAILDQNASKKSLFLMKNKCLFNKITPFLECNATLRPLGQRKYY